jgi:glutathionylspermidine synthase
MMLRKAIQPRPFWQATLEAQGFDFHTMDGQPYWNETAYYEFTEREATILEKASQELHDLCLHAVEVVINRGWLRTPAHTGLDHSSH